MTCLNHSLLQSIPVRTYSTNCAIILCLKNEIFSLYVEVFANLMPKLKTINQPETAEGRIGLVVPAYYTLYSRCTI